MIKMKKNSVYDNYKNLDDKKFKEAVGIPKILFDMLVPILASKVKIVHKKGGRTPKLCIEDLLLMTLKYYRDYPTFSSISLSFGIDKSNAFRWINKIENMLNDIFENLINIEIKCSDLSKKGKEITISEKIVDVTECSIQRPKNQETQREYYSGKKKKHTIKIQIIIDEITKQIISVDFDKGSVHDFKLFKNTTEELDKTISFLADNGYLGIQNIFEKSLTPKKKSKYNPLSDEDKEFNKLISNIRIAVEHVNCQLKIFRILAERYRSRIETFNLRAILICCFYNFCL